MHTLGKGKSVFKCNLLGRRPGLLRKAQREAGLYQVSLKSGKAMPGAWDRAVNMPLEKADVPRSTVGGLDCPERRVGGGEERNQAGDLRPPWTLKHRSSCRVGASQWLWSRPRWAEVRDTKCSRRQSQAAGQRGPCSRSHGRRSIKGLGLAGIEVV